jgi:hypothetical protein
VTTSRDNDFSKWDSELDSSPTMLDTTIVPCTICGTDVCDEDNHTNEEIESLNENERDN